MDGGVDALPHTKPSGDNKKKDTPVKNKKDHGTHLFLKKYEIPAYRQAGESRNSKQIAAVYQGTRTSVWRTSENQGIRQKKIMEPTPTN
jgi:hypothetical protein